MQYDSSRKYRNCVVGRGVVFLLAFSLTMGSILFGRAVYTYSLDFNPHLVHVPGWFVVAADFLWLMIPQATQGYAGDPMKYYFGAIAHLLAVVAHLYFFCSPFIVFIPSSSKIRRVLRYFAPVLTFIWVYPIINYFHPLAVRTWKLEEDFYSMGIGYMVVMCCILHSPRRPEVGPAFPVVEGGRKLEV